MRELRGQRLSLRAIAEALAEDGIALSHVAVQKVLARDDNGEKTALKVEAAAGQPALGTRW